MLDALRSEFLDETMGPLITARVRGLVKTMLEHRDPLIYARGSRDYRDGLEDVLHEFAIDVLLHEGQLQYALDNAADEHGFDRLINRQLRRYLARTRERSIVDNLLERSIRVLREDDRVVAAGSGQGLRFRLAEGGPEESGRDRELAVRDAMAIAGNSVQRIYSNPDERSPKVYSDEDLGTLLRVYMGVAAVEIGRSDLHELFVQLLTPWTASVLGLDEAVGDERPELSPEEQMLVNEVAAQITESWEQTDAVVFMHKLGNLADKDLAVRLGVSRPTAAKAKKDLFARLSEELIDVDPHLRTAVISAVAHHTAGLLP